jgi:hypothetical protein
MKKWNDMMTLAPKAANSLMDDQFPAQRSIRPKNRCGIFRSPVLAADCRRESLDVE